MTANSNLTLTTLDFDLLKKSFVSFLKGQTIFKDADFEGSNLNVLLDELSYNSHLNAFYLNMVFAEMFNDSAQLYDSVVSHAKELNYVPISSKSASANVSFVLSTNGINSTITIPKGCYFSGQNSNGSFGFVTDKSSIYTSSNSTFTINNLRLFQGSYINDVFVIDNSLDKQQFVLSNPNIDTDSITVTVTENNSNTVFNRADNLYNLTSNSNVYFLQAAQSSKYEILFGDNVFGRLPINQALVNVNYRVTQGSKGNNVKSFNLNQNLGNYNNGVATISGTVNTISNSSGGVDSQDIESIRFYAPRYFATQQRAVSSDDYSSLILANFTGEIGDVTVYGGETVYPKKYGTTIICLKPVSGLIVPDYTKNKITNYFLKLSKLPKNTSISDPDYFNICINTNITYDSTLTSSSVDDIKTNVLNSMVNFFATNNSKFNQNFRYSKFTTGIDDTDESILSNDTEVFLIKKLYPVFNLTASYIINYNNSFYKIEFPYEITNIPVSENKPSLYSSKFTYVLNNVLYPDSIIRDDNYGKLVVLNNVNDIVSVINDNIGSVDYETGLVQIDALRVSSFQGATCINLYMIPRNSDISIEKNQILNLDPVDISINIKDQEDN